MIYNRSFDIRLNEQFFGAIITALDSFANNLIEGGLTKFEMVSSKITILKVNDFIFVASSSNKIKNGKVENELKTVSERFFNKYSKTLENLSDDPNNFCNFEKEIADLLQDPMETFWVDKFWEGL